jgi:ATP-dependent DNA ligase
MDNAMELNQIRIEDAIVREVADNIIGNDDLYSRVKRVVEDRIDSHFRTTADAQIKAAIEVAITKGFEHEYHRTDAFGKWDGSPTTIRAELEKMIGGYWNTKVDKSGKPSSGYGADLTRAEWTMTQLVAADFQGEMKQHIVNLGGTMKDKLRAELHETVNKLLSEIFHVNSAVDQTMRRSDRSIIDPKAAS